MASPRHPERRLVGVSTKMYFSASRTGQYVDQLLQLLSDSDNSQLDNIDVFVIPDHVTLTSVIDKVKGKKLWCGAQDTFYEDAGAYTGEVSPAVLSEVGCKLVEVGHAERRRMFGETDEITAKKAAATARNGMVPLVCIGEKTRGETSIAAVDQCRSQIEAVLSEVADDADVILAYEPVWAIGAAQPADVGYVVEVTSAIRQLECIQKRRGSTRILYGGSAGPGLFEKLKDGVDGLFLGRFAHDPAQFYKTIQEVASA
ncbi:Triosephosphate isomerase [Mariannaea sp. PMI_226]|nr:Triosephosphate isomerase [Mariannaea sp. PMI_226]